MTQPTPGDRARQQYEDVEKKTAAAMERLVGSEAFAESLAMFVGNVTALVRVADLGLDQVVRATRLAGRRDIARLGRQIARTEDKLENVLVVVEGLEAELALARRERDEARGRLEGGESQGESQRDPGGTSTGAPRRARAARTTRAASSDVLTRGGSDESGR